jgi:hypothetical protein
MDHPMRTLLYELFLEPVTQRLERISVLFAGLTIAMQGSIRPPY